MARDPKLCTQKINNLWEEIKTNILKPQQKKNQHAINIKVRPKPCKIVIKQNFSTFLEISDKESASKKIKLHVYQAPQEKQ